MTSGTELCGIKPVVSTGDGIEFTPAAAHQQPEEGWRIRICVVTAGVENDSPAGHVASK
jgi:hypothetical protein